MDNKHSIPSTFDTDIKFASYRSQKKTLSVRDYRIVLLVSGIVVGIITALLVCPHSARGLQQLLEAIGLSAH